MMEMHSFFTAKQIEIPSPDCKGNPTARDLFELLYQISQWIQTPPQISRSEKTQADTVYLWFDDVAFAEDDFWQIFGECLARLRTRWRIDLFGTAGPSQETVWLSLQEEDHRLYAVQKTLSGRPADTIESLCLKIQCASCEQAEILYALAAAANWESGVAALDWKYGPFLQKEALAMPTQNSCFCYGGLFEDAGCEDALQALDFEKKIALWSGFLKYGFDYTEFEWLYQTISENDVSNRIEWELSLHTAMQDLKYTVKVSPSDFELRDGYGSRRYYSFNSTSCAERTFLKMLFPLNV